MWWRMLTVFVALADALPIGDYPQVRITNGIVRGRKLTTALKGIAYYAYQGVPYAEPPIGSLRFKPPRPPKNWDGILNATGDHIPCVQTKSNITPKSSEDCLYLNVYRPENISSPLPVMVMSPGGGFLILGADDFIFGPDHLMEQQVVFVMFNYRLGVFGFLSTEDLACPGNYGLKDQIQALKWVQENVHYFGGDPKQVTLFGESAGGTSVHYLMQTPKAKNLFHRVIAQSGNSLCPWAVNKHYKQTAFRVAEAAGINSTNTQELVDKLRKMDAEELLQRSSNIGAWGVITSTGFLPTLEPEHEEAILTKGSLEMLSNGEFLPVPLIVGITAQEAATDLFHIDTLAELLLYFSDPTIMDDLEFPQTAKILANKARKFYLTNSPNFTERENACTFFSDYFFFNANNLVIKLHSRLAPVYSYLFSYEGPLGTFNEPRKMKGVGHSEDLHYLFKFASFLPNNERDRLMSAKVVKLWTNFAKTGNPTPEQDPELDNVIWPQATIENGLAFLDINSNLSVGSNYKEETVKFWDECNEEFGQPPYDFLSNVTLF